MIDKALHVLYITVMLFFYGPIIFRRYRKDITRWLNRGRARPRTKPAQPAEDGQAISAVLRPSFRAVPTYLFRQEIVIIVLSGIILNFVGLSVSLHLESILYLDMIGTAVAAILLGPWWGAVVGLLSNSLLNRFLFVTPQPTSPEVHIFQWTVVNVAGGLIWGFMGRTARFRKYLQSDETSDKPHLYYLLAFGVLGAGLLSIFGTGVQASLGGGCDSGLALDKRVADALCKLLTDLQDLFRGPLEGLAGSGRGLRLAWIPAALLTNWIRYIPDKTISAAIALAIVKYGFPLFKRQLILGGSSGIRPRDNWLGPLVFGLLYAPSFTYFMTVNDHRRFGVLWAFPLAVAFCGLVVLLWRGPSHSETVEARNARLNSYLRVFAGMKHSGTVRFSDDYGLWFGTKVASFVFILCLPLLGIVIGNYQWVYWIALKFSIVVFGFLFAVQVILIMAAQNLGNLVVDVPPETASKAASSSPQR